MGQIINQAAYGVSFFTEKPCCPQPPRTGSKEGLLLLSSPGRAGAGVQAVGATTWGGPGEAQDRRAGDRRPREGEVPGLPRASIQPRFRLQPLRIHSHKPKFPASPSTTLRSLSLCSHGSWGLPQPQMQTSTRLGFWSPEPVVQTKPYAHPAARAHRRCWSGDPGLASSLAALRPH